ncbi:MAG: aminotransferase class I/II-fold pyridoxal phosphate-dependent enzyme [Spirochaetes bacterium]|nr:aminotransferase class I/II-fold pyridoxal phosphate-dependent enzyme [Spirochaetota bacterium]
MNIDKNSIGCVEINSPAMTVEKCLAELEGSEECLLFPSGMSAIVTTLLAYVKSGDHIIITDDCYKRTLEFCSSYLARMGVECSVVPFGDYELLESSIRDNTCLIFSESPTNPYLNIFNLEKFNKIAVEKNILTIIDSTFATPANQRPLEYGIDIVIHSVTKYLGGHNDIMAGAVLGRRDVIAPVRDLMIITGESVNIFRDSLLIKSLKTFPMRMKIQNESAFELARYLEKNEKVKKVYYPFLESHRHYDIAKAQMAGGGGVVSFDIKGNLNEARKFLNSLKMISIGPSLGGVETLITHPAMVSYYYYSREERNTLGITDSLFRLAVGLEDTSDIIEDLDRGFASI